MKRRPIPAPKGPEFSPIDGAEFLGTWDTSHRGDATYNHFRYDVWYEAAVGRFHSHSTNFGGCLTAYKDKARAFAADFPLRPRNFTVNWPEVLVVAEKRGLIPVEERASA